ncbi:GyrI-like domain-containing protein [Paenibacillus gorillae]|uniref:GyrI-like domain-containing protein n=1 Tax=Paenibacillus gorillae TaxID=1243662 RepID=UPI0004B8F1F5|nr:GyrI-like domain-containing protein [Paenibacillus gorillae]
MNLELVQQLERSETKLAGYTVTVSLNQDLAEGIIVQLREQLKAQRHHIEKQTDSGIYLVQVYSDEEWTPDTPFESIVAVEVGEIGHLPEGMVSYTLPAGAYAKVIHTGAESDIGDTYDLISDEGIASLRPFDFEYWADLNAIEQGEGAIEIYLPV